jgi:hypothetical protein
MGIKQRSIHTYIINLLFCRYDIPWYVTPVRIQKLVMFLLQRSTKTFALQIGGLFIGSLEGFATVMNLLSQRKIIFSIDFIR